MRKKKKSLTFLFFFLSFYVAKPAPLRNCTLRPYLTSTYAITMNSTNLTASTAHSNQNYNNQQQLNGPKELNYINTEYMKDRNVFVSTASKKSTKSKNATINMAKFNKKSLLTANGRGSSNNNDDDNDGDDDDDDGDFATNNDGIRDSNTKTRRNAKSYNQDKHKKSYLPRTKDENLDDGAVMVGDDSDIDYVESDEDGDAGNGMTRPAFSTAKSNLSYMTSRMDHQRNAKQQNFHQDIKRNLKSWAKGSNGHKTNGDDTVVNDMSFRSSAAVATATDGGSGDRGERGSAILPDLLSSSSRLFSTSTIKSMITASNEVAAAAAAAAASGGNDRSRTRDDGYARKNKNRNHSDNHKNYNNLEMKSGFGLHKPNAAYLKTPSEPKSMPSAINNHHLNSNNVIVDSYESPPTTMELECVAGYDGGLPQHFVLEAYDSRTKKLRLNITSAFSDIPLFRIDLAGMCTKNIRVLSEHSVRAHSIRTNIYFTLSFCSFFANSCSFVHLVFFSTFDFWSCHGLCHSVFLVFSCSEHGVFLSLHFAFISFEHIFGVCVCAGRENIHMPRVICVITQNRIEMVAAFLHYLFPPFMIIARDFLLFEKVNDRTFFSHIKCHPNYSTRAHLGITVHVYAARRHFGIRTQPIMHINLHVFSASIPFLRIFCFSLDILVFFSLLYLMVHVAKNVPISKINPLFVCVGFLLTKSMKFIGAIECVFLKSKVHIVSE